MNKFTENRILALRDRMELRARHVSTRLHTLERHICNKSWSEAEQEADEIHRLLATQNTTEQILSDLE